MENEKKNENQNWLILRRKVAEHRIQEIFRVFRETGIEPILIKGWAAGLKYCRPWERTFSDTDIAVNPLDYQKALAASAEAGLTVDLHRGLRHLDTLDWNKLYQNSKLALIGDTEIRILSDEDHLRVLCVHWLNDGGADKEKLLDVYYAVKNRRVDFDWELCLGVVKPQRRKWIICAIGLAHKYFGLPIDDLAFADEARRIPVWLLTTLENEWKSGVRLFPLDACLSDRKMLFRQILKRIPPNPIQATIEMEGDLDSRRRLFYQIATIGIRLKLSLHRLLSR